MSGLRVGDAVRLAVVTALGSVALAIATGLLVYARAGSAVTLAARGLLVTALLVLAVRSCLAGRPEHDRLPTGLAGLLGGYVLGLGWTSGTTYVARAVTGSVAVAAVLDLVLWLAVGVLALRRLPPGPAGPGSGYG